jgi:hypothetical protein
MSIRVQCPNSACGKTMTVKEQLAGKTGKCPACGTPIVVPPLAAPESVPSFTPAPPAPDWDAMTDSPSAAAEPAPLAPRRQGNRPSSTWIIIGMVALGVLALSTLLPWVTVSVNMRTTFSGMSVGGLSNSQSKSGLNYVEGATVFFLSVGVAVFLIVAFFAQPKLLLASAWTGVGWGGLALILQMVQLVRILSSSNDAPMVAIFSGMISVSVGFGLYLGLAAAAGAAATLALAAVKLQQEPGRPPSI